MRANKRKISYCLFVLSVGVFFVLTANMVKAQDFNYPYNSEKNRDLLQPLVNSQGEIIIDRQKEAGRLNLQGIIYSPPTSRAIINSEVYRRGDKIKGQTIIKIKEKEVIIEDKTGKISIMKWGGE